MTALDDIDEGVVPIAAKALGIGPNPVCEVADAPVYARLRARVVDCGGCWHVLDPRTGAPLVRIDAHVHGKQVKLRRGLWIARYGQPRRGALISPVCGDVCCHRPEHCRALSLRQSRGLASRRGAYSSPAAAARIARTRRSASTLSDEAVADIRASTDSHVDAGRRHGISPDHVRLIRAGRRRRELVSPMAYMVNTCMRRASA